MAGNKRDEYGRDIQSWLDRIGGRAIVAIAAVLVLWSAVVIFG